MRLFLQILLCCPTLAGNMLAESKTHARIQSRWDFPVRDNMLAESKTHARIQSRWDCPVMDNILAESKTHVIIRSRRDDIFVKGYIYLLSLEKVISNVSLRSRDVFPFFCAPQQPFLITNTLKSNKDRYLSYLQNINK